MLSFSAISAAVLAYLVPIGAGILAYLAKYGVAIALKAAPVAATALLLFVFFAVGGFWLKLGVVLLTLAAFALGFEVGEAVEAK